MGAWGVSAFENDDGCDFVYELEEVDDFSVVESAIDTVNEADGYLEAPDAGAALAACEVIAMANGRGGVKNPSTEIVDAWIARHKLKPSAQLVQRAKGAITRVLGEESELRELWDESDHAKEWRKAVEDLRARLGSDRDGA